MVVTAADVGLHPAGGAGSAVAAVAAGSGAGIGVIEEAADEDNEDLDDELALFDQLRLAQEDGKLCSLLTSAHTHTHTSADMHPDTSRP